MVILLFVGFIIGHLIFLKKVVNQLESIDTNTMQMNLLLRKLLKRSDTNDV